MKDLYIIEDWAGNHLFKDKTFKSFEDGWEFLYELCLEDEDYEDYYVIKK